MLLSSLEELWGSANSPAAEVTYCYHPAATPGRVSYHCTVTIHSGANTHRGGLAT